MILKAIDAAGIRKALNEAAKADLVTNRQIGYRLEKLPKVPRFMWHERWFYTIGPELFVAFPELEDQLS